MYHSDVVWSLEGDYKGGLHLLSKIPGLGRSSSSDPSLASISSWSDFSSTASMTSVSLCENSPASVEDDFRGRNLCVSDSDPPQQRISSSSYTPVRSVRGHKSCPTSLCLSADGNTLYSSGKDCCVIQCNVFSEISVLCFMVFLPLGFGSSFLFAEIDRCIEREKEKKREEMESCLESKSKFF